MSTLVSIEPLPENIQSPLRQTPSSALNTPSLKLDPQFFTGNPLERSLDVLQKFDGSAAPGASTEVSLIVVSGRSICVRNSENDATNPNIDQDLQALLLGVNDPQLDLNSEFISFIWQRDQVPGEAAEHGHASGSSSVRVSESCPEADYLAGQRLPLYLLGRDQEQRWTFAVDISSCRQGFLSFLKTSCGLDVKMGDLRMLMPTLSREACAIAGQAVALAQWHDAHQYCPRCGGPTVPVETGLRRRCTLDVAHKLYPRTDPVVIMLVESPDGNRALLGRSKKFTSGMYTCLSGFIDQCESVEEAVRREVREEARVQVDQVHILGTQPWPIGRYGTCELMLGCFAKAKSYEIMVNTAEMEDVQWYDRSELLAAVQLYEQNKEETMQSLQQRSMESLGFWIPPPVAVAHHLIRQWVLHGEPFFPSGNTLPKL